MKNKEKKIGYLIVIVMFICGSISVFAGDLDINYPNQLGEMTVQDAFEKLKEVNYISRNKNLSQGIYAAYNNRKDAAIRHAINVIRKPVIEVYENEVINRGKDFYVAKNILNIFSNESLDYLIQEYENSRNNILKVNIIRVLGGIKGENITEVILRQALEDKSFYNISLPETVGKPLRVCDEAYNQLILRYITKGTLRTIGNSHSLEIRDYHINLLISQFDKSPIDK